MPHHRHSMDIMDDDHYVEGANGTIAEQEDEAYYDDRSDADDDLEKGRIRFPQTLYGREHELQTLQHIYDDLVTRNLDSKESGKEEVLPEQSTRSDEVAAAEQSLEPDLESDGSSAYHYSNPYDASRVIFLSGYSGVGKSALVQEFVKRVQQQKRSQSQNRCTTASNSSPSSKHSSKVWHVCGKYTEQSAAISAPFSAIAEVLEKLTLHYLAGNGNKNENDTDNDDPRSKVIGRIRESSLIGPGTRGNRALRVTFPILGSLLGSCDGENEIITGYDDTPTNTSVPSKRRTSSLCISMNAIGECTAEIFSAICHSLEYPLILFFDDLQWADEASISIFSHLLLSKDLGNVVFVCAYRSNEVHDDHSFTSLMEGVVAARSNGHDHGDNDGTMTTVERMDLFSLTPEAIARFIADCVKKEEPEDVADLAEVVYQKTMGNIFFVRLALEELVRKNALFYDVMCFEWRWVVSKVELSDYMSDDVLETVKGKIEHLPGDIRRLLVVMAHLPNALDVSMLNELMSDGEYSFGEVAIRNLLEEASGEGMLMLSVESGNYVLAHDRIRQASLELCVKENQDDLLLHIAGVLLDFEEETKMDWCIFSALNILNNMPPHKTDCTVLARLNLRVATISKFRGDSLKEHELLLKGLACLEASGSLWRDYELSYDLYNAIIISEYSVGAFDKARAAIDEIINHAKTLDEKLSAYMHQVLCTCDETRDYSRGVEDGIKVLKLYGYDIPLEPTAIYMVKEGAKLKKALRNHSFSYLIGLQVVADFPILALFKHLTKYAFIASKEKVVSILAWKAIQYTVKNGIDSNFPRILGLLSASVAKQGSVKTAFEIGNVALALSEKIRDDKDNYAQTQMGVHGSVVCQLQPYRNSIEHLHQCYMDLKLVGSVEVALGSMLCYAQSYLAAGLKMNSILESHLYRVGEYCKAVGRTSFQISFQIIRQFVMNLRKRTGHPTEFRGKMFHEEETLSKMNGKGTSMVLRDSSSHRLQLAFIFWDENTMDGILNKLESYPMTDIIMARLHNRLCFTGLAAIALGKERGSKSFQKMGQKCSSYFAHLAKHGSINARPVHLFMMAMKNPSRKAFNKTIAACAEAKFMHLEAMAMERYAAFLNTQHDAILANDYITSAYWLYYDWGAHAKTLELSNRYGFLKHSKRKTLKNSTLSTSETEKSFHSFTATFRSKSTRNTLGSFPLQGRMVPKKQRATQIN